METPYPFIRDSLSPRPGPPEETGAPTGAELFGPESSVALVPPDGIAARPASADTPGQSYAYEAVTLGVLAIFCYLLHSYRSSLAEAFKVVTMQLSIEKAFAEQTLFFRQFLTLSSLWGILLGQRTRRPLRRPVRTLHSAAPDGGRRSRSRRRSRRA